MSSDVSLGHIRDAREIKTLSLHLVGEREWPHPELVAEYLLHVLQPQHIVFIWLFFQTAFHCATVGHTNAWVPDLLVLHHIDAG